MPPRKSPSSPAAKEPDAGRDFDEWLGDGRRAIFGVIGLRLEDCGTEGDDRAGWASGSFRPTAAACDGAGAVPTGLCAVVLDAAMSLAVSAGLPARQRVGGALEMNTEIMRAAMCGERLAVRGAVMSKAKQVVFAEARIEDEKGRLVSRATASFLARRN